LSLVVSFLFCCTAQIVCVTHDRFFLDNLTQWILELDSGKGIPYEGNYSTFLEAKARRLEQSEKSESALRRQITTELEWIRASPKGRQSKSKARVSRYEELVEEENRAANNRSGAMDHIYIPPGPLLGGIVVEAEGVKKVYGDRVLFENMTFSLPRGGIVGVIGPNGSGKVSDAGLDIAAIASEGNSINLRLGGRTFARSVV
jgi:energy-dependent translational throttle protein EttA